MAHGSKRPVVAPALRAPMAWPGHPVLVNPAVATVISGWSSMAPNVPSTLSAWETACESRRWKSGPATQADSMGGKNCRAAT